MNVIEERDPIIWNFDGRTYSKRRYKLELIHWFCHRREVVEVIVEIDHANGAASDFYLVTPAYAKDYRYLHSRWAHISELTPELLIETSHA